jgi:hypothetical protein
VGGVALGLAGLGAVIACSYFELTDWVEHYTPAPTSPVMKPPPTPGIGPSQGLFCNEQDHEPEPDEGE